MRTQRILPHTYHSSKGKVIRSKDRHVAARVWAEGLEYDHKGHRELLGVNETVLYLIQTHIGAFPL